MKQPFMIRRARSHPAIHRRGSHMRPPPRSLACIVLVVGMLLAHGARLAHMLLVQHVVCEHGAFIHGHEARSASPDADEERAQAVHHKGTSKQASEHEHCDAPSIPHRPLARQPVVADARLRLCIAPPPPAESSELRPLPPLAVAPKASPTRC